MLTFSTVTRTMMRGSAIAALSIVMTACSLGLTDVPDPTTIIDPSKVESQDGAIALYRSAVSQFTTIYAGGGVFLSVPPFVLSAGLGSDEYWATLTGASVMLNLRAVDPGSMLNYYEISQPYSDLHLARLNIGQAIGALRRYGVTTPPSYIGELLAYRGYVYLMFAEMFCSGIPFSEVLYDGDIQYGHPISTEDMLQRAVASFDSAMATATDSIRIRQLAQVGKARALLNLGEFSQAAALVSPDSIPTNFVYNMLYTAQGYPNYLAVVTQGLFGNAEIVMADRAGVNGLDYLSAGDTTGGRQADPRVQWKTILQGAVPLQFSVPTNPVALANGIEARLIEAEAALQTPDITQWKSILNTLRQNASTPIPMLSDDSTTTAGQTLRENVMFRERAFWLFGTGHRFGDMRRLVRQYHRLPSDVFPRGTQPRLYPPDNVYSDAVTFIPPKKEAQTNPYYQGCFNRDA